MYLHQQLIEKYRLDVSAMPANIRQMITDFSASEVELNKKTQGGEISRVYLDESKLDEAGKDFLDEELAGNHGSKTYREMLNPATQGFFAKGTHTLYGIPAYAFWTADKEFFNVSPEIYEAVTLPEISNYSGSFSEKDLKVFEFAQVNYDKLINEIDENIVGNIMDFLRKQDDLKQFMLEEKKDSESCLYDKIANAGTDASKIYSLLRDTFGDDMLHDQDGERIYITQSGERRFLNALLATDFDGRVRYVSLYSNLADGNSATGELQIGLAFVHGLKKAIVLSIRMNVELESKGKEGLTAKVLIARFKDLSSCQLNESDQQIKRMTETTERFLENLIFSDLVSLRTVKEAIEAELGNEGKEEPTTNYLPCKKKVDLKSIGKYLRVKNGKEDFNWNLCSEYMKDKFKVDKKEEFVRVFITRQENGVECIVFEETYKISDSDIDFNFIEKEINENEPDWKQFVSRKGVYTAFVLSNHPFSIYNFAKYLTMTYGLYSKNGK